MAEYIEREAISEEIRKYYYKNPPNFSYGEGFDRGLDRAQRAILDAPAADVAPVVHCCDCKHLRIHNNEEVYACCSKTGYIFLPFETDTRAHFCGFGERMDGDG